MFTEQPNDCRLTTGVDFVSIIIKNDNKKAQILYYRSYMVKAQPAKISSISFDNDNVLFNVFRKNPQEYGISWEMKTTFG